MSHLVGEIKPRFDEGGGENGLFREPVISIRIAIAPA
jgi:hypothetical protein